MYTAILRHAPETTPENVWKPRRPTLANVSTPLAVPLFCILASCGRPAIGERVLVKFHDKVWYKGTINARVGSTTEGKHEWGVLFDDCTTDTFETGEIDGK